MKKIETKDEIVLAGKVTLSAFQPNAIARLLGYGFTLNDAIREARMLGLERRRVESTNLVTTVGKQFISRRITGEEMTGLTYMAVGTGTTDPAVSDIALETETLRKLLTECEQGDANFYSTVYLLASECSFYLKEGGLFGGAAAGAAADSGSLLCRFLLDFDNTTLQQDLTIQHTGEVS